MNSDAAAVQTTSKMNVFGATKKPAATVSFSGASAPSAKAFAGGFGGGNRMVIG